LVRHPSSEQIHQFSKRSLQVPGRQVASFRLSGTASYLFNQVI